MSRRRSPNARLFDALQAADKAITFLEGRSLAQFSADAKVQSAVYFQLIVIGEAMNQAAKDDPGIADGVPALPAIVGLRNRLVHAYHDIDDEVILAILTERLPEFRQQEERLLAAQP